MLASYINGILFGKVTIVVEGFFIEKYINICTVRRIALNDIKRKNSCIFTAKVNIKDFKKLKSICKKTRCKVNILKKDGLPFILHKYRKRKLIFAMILLSMILVIVANSYILNIKVINSDDVEYNKLIIDTLSELNIQKYKCKYFIDKEYIKNQMLIKIDDLSWIELEVKGVTLIVDIHKKILKPEIIDKNEVCNIVASKPGVVEKIVIREGNQNCNIGDVVDVGDILVSGIIPSKFIDERFVRADAEIYAKVWYSKKIEIPYYEKRVEYTGNKKKIYGINLLNKKVFLGKLSTNFKEYDTMLNENNISVNKHVFPIKYYEYVFAEKNIEIIQRDKKQAIDYGLNVLEEKLNCDISKDTSILEKRNITFEKENSIQVELIYECLEQIGTQEKIN